MRRSRRTTDPARLAQAHRLAEVMTQHDPAVLGFLPELSWRSAARQAGVPVPDEATRRLVAALVHPVSPIPAAEAELTASFDAILAPLSVAATAMRRAAEVHHNSGLALQFLQEDVAALADQVSSLRLAAAVGPPAPRLVAVQRPALSVLPGGVA